MGTDGLCVDVNMVGTWMLCGNTDAGCKHWKNTRKRNNLTIKHTGLCVDVNMVGTWMLCGNTGAGCKHWKEHRKTQKPHDKTHQNAAYLQKHTHDNARYVQEAQENARENKARPPSIIVL